MEVLEAYNSTKLVISGNSSQLAPWHAKLGFQMGVSIATLNSLTPDGGVIAVMDLVVLKVCVMATLGIKSMPCTHHDTGIPSGVHRVHRKRRWTSS